MRGWSLAMVLESQEKSSSSLLTGTLWALDLTMYQTSVLLKKMPFFSTTSILGTNISSVCENG